MSGGKRHGDCETPSGDLVSLRRETTSDAASSGVPEGRPCQTASDAASSGVVFGGAQWMTLIDYPGRIAAILFTVGCNYRCPFCHNPELVDPQRIPAGLDEDEIIQRLRERVGFLDGVVISGGEPTIQASLPAFVERVKELGLLVKLDTNGSRPEMLSRILGEHLADYIAMDVKAPLDQYARLAGIVADADAIEESITRIAREAPDYEFRTTAAPTLGREDILRIAERLTGAKRYVLQTFRVSEKGLLNPAWEAKEGLSKEELDGLWDEIGSAFADGGVRG